MVASRGPWKDQELLGTLQESGGQRSAQHQYYTSNEGRSVETKDVWGKWDAQEIENFL